VVDVGDEHCQGKTHGFVLELQGLKIQQKVFIFYLGGVNLSSWIWNGWQVWGRLRLILGNWVNYWKGLIGTNLDRRSHSLQNRNFIKNNGE